MKTNYLNVNIVMQNLKTKTTKVDASKLKFDREKGVLEQRPDFDPLRTY